MAEGSVWKRMGVKKDVLKILPQTGKFKDILRDKSRKARLPGKRISKTGKIYWESRRNRSDAPMKNI